MKILAVLMEYDYGVKERGNSYEYYNIYLPLCDVYGTQNVMLYDFFSEYKTKGKKFVNDRIKEIVQSEKPDISLFCLFENEIESSTIQKINAGTRTLCYFIDDPWRVEFAHFWAKHFQFFSTPDYFTYTGYLTEGFKNVFHSPFGFNRNIYKRKEMNPKYDVSFIGGHCLYREWIISMLKKQGIHVHTFGRGWKSNAKWLSQDQMVDVFNQSKINLNLSNAISYDSKFFRFAVKSPYNLIKTLRIKKFREQIKGRHFEINGCGGFQLSYYVQGLNLAYEIEKEIAVFDNVYNLADTIKFYLRENELREQIRNAGYERSIKEHTSQEYLRKLVEQVSRHDC